MKKDDDKSLRVAEKVTTGDRSTERVENTPEHRAGNLLFGSPNYEPNNTDSEFLLPHTDGKVWISYRQLVAVLRAEQMDRDDLRKALGEAS